MDAWLTKDSIPSGSRKCIITIPDDEQWLADLRGCFLLLTLPENWEKFGTLSPDEMADKWRSVFFNFLGCPMDLTPVGAVLAYAGYSEPEGWLFCDGAAISRADYADLFGVIGTIYGVGDGTTTFNLPNLGGRSVIGPDIADSSMNSIGEVGGEKQHVLTTAELASHNHTQDSHNHTQNSHNHTQDSHNHTQNSHNHTQNSHNHTQNSHNHTQDPHAHADNWFVVGAGTKWDGGGASFVPQANSGSTFDQTAINNAATAVNQVATAVNQVATATNQAATATNQAATATNQAATATNQAAGSGSAHNNMQPFLVLNYMIKVLP